MEKNIEISMLCEIYKNMLTEKQAELLDQYYNKDFSLSEIAENYNITRQAVRDNIKSGENKLYDLEEKLKIKEKISNQKEIIENILKKLDEIKTEDTYKIKNIKKHLKELI